MAQLVVFTDLDGTLLDARDYSFAPAREALALLRQLMIPIIFCTSKTRAEVAGYRERLNNPHPFIVENGACIYIPEGYFPFVVDTVAEHGFHKIELGRPYTDLRRGISILKGRGFRVRGFGDMTDGDVAALAGLTHEEARLARMREYDEPFLFEGGGEDVPRLEAAIRETGLSLTKGRFFHLMGGSDKGKAVNILKGLYSRVLEGMVTCALGDNANDLPMFEAVDYPFLVRKPDGTHAALEGTCIVRTEGIGPQGWNEAVTGLLKKLKIS